MASACVIALELIIYLCRRAELFLKAVCSDEGRGAVHFVEAAYLLGNGEICSGQLLKIQELQNGITFMLV